MRRGSSEITNDKLSQLLNDGYPIENLLRDLITYTKPTHQNLLVSCLQKYSKNEIKFYLPQLVNLSLYFPSYNSYSNIFKKLIMADQGFALNIIWFLLGYAKNEETKGVEKKLAKLESVIINGSAAPGSPPVPIYKISDIQDEVHFRKLIREEYFEQQKKFVVSLMKKSENLTSDIKYLDIYLTSYLNEVNNILNKLRSRYSAELIENYTSRLYRGIVLPLDFDDYPEQIVRILSSESVCFKTKTRVPFLMIFETIDLNEITHPTEDLEKRIKNYLSYDENDSKYTERNTNTWPELWEEKSKRLRKLSAFGVYKTWKLRGVIVKSKDNLRQEHLAMQIIKKCHKIFQDSSLNLYLRPYNIIVVGHDSGMIEYIPDTVSLHQLKKENPGLATLQEIYQVVWGKSFEEAQRNFIQSMAGYSVVSYIMNLKDRHNGNILIDFEGHIIHIDFGFFLTNSPGGNLGFESAPFKLTEEMIELMGGKGSDMYTYYIMLVCAGFLAVRKKADDLGILIEIMEIGSDFQCFVDKGEAAKGFRERMMVNLEENLCLEKVRGLIEDAEDHWTTNQYDFYQKSANDICS